MSSNSVPLVFVTSSVCGRKSFGGGRRPALHEASLGVADEAVDVDVDGLVD
jgi:hypothetical protein